MAGIGNGASPYRFREILMLHRWLGLFSILLLFPLSAAAKPKEAAIVCDYLTQYGEMRQAPSLNEVPRASRAQARCRPANQNQLLAKPDDIKLQGSQRVENIVSPLGDIKLRWPRKVESLFGRTPLRAMTDAARTVNRAIKNAAFPANIQNLNLTWNVVFMDESLPEGQIPTNLVTDCHPGWMTPPANIYIVAQRVAGGCGGQRSSTSVADATLAQVLVHEMGHAVEYYMLRQNSSFDRVRAEGFATWFEGYASQYSSILNSREIQRQQFDAARSSFRHNPGQFDFSGTFEDYSRASMYFTAVVAARGLSGLIELYQQMNSSGMDLLSAISATTHWDNRRLQKEIADLLAKN
jgi:hypothetical protein